MLLLGLGPRKGDWSDLWIERHHAARWGVRRENGRTFLTTWKLEDRPRFVKKLRATDEVAVEITGNTRLFHDAVASHVARVVVVDSNQFRVISRW